MTKTIIIKHELPEWSDEYVARLSSMFTEFDFRAAHNSDELKALAPEAHAIIVIGPKVPPELIAMMTKLEWVQTLTAGFDNFLHMETLPPHVPVTNIVGIHGPQVSEVALLMMLSLARQFPQVLDAQRRAVWDRQMQPALFGKTLCILGLGSIAETLARYASTLGMVVVGVSNGRESTPHVERIYRRADLPTAVAEADFLVVLVPLSDATRHIVDASLLSAMKTSSYLINLARGGCVDEAALINALKNGEIAGAGLDVFEEEPLPPTNPLWRAPNLIITPHVGGFADIFAEQCYPTILSNLRIYSESGASALKSVLPGNHHAK